MNKNPFAPTPSYVPTQPPLPPGPPPPQPGQPDYSAWWASASAQQAHAQQPAAPQYAQQWTAPQPARPAHEQSALYANYGYGNHPNAWQRQQQQQAQPYQPPQPYHPPAPQQPPAQPAYNPYQPTAGYPQAYVPQPAVPQPPPQPMAQPVFQPPTQPQQFFNPHLQAQGSQPPRIHHGPAQHQHPPPAKRQRFDGPNNNRPLNQHPTMTQNQFQPPAPSAPGSFTGPTGTRAGPPSGPSQMSGAGRGGGPGGRGGAQGNRGRGGSFTANRGGGAGRGGRGGGAGSGFLGTTGNANRGGAPGQPGGALRGHGSRNNFGAGGARRGAGGSFNAGGYHRGSSFRNPAHTTTPNRPGARHDGTGGPNNASYNKDAAGNTSFSNVGKKDENRRTLTDFKIVGLSIPELDWSWGQLPDASQVVIVKEEVVESNSSLIVKDEVADDKTAVQADHVGDGKDASASETKPDVLATSTQAPQAPAGDSKPAPEAPALRYPADINGNNPPPSRMRIYFHTPVTPDDSRPIPHNTSMYEENRKGKRKKLEDDDGDLEEGRVPPPPPQMSGMSDDRSSVAASVAPSVAETASEGDWLMAAIVAGEQDGGAQAGQNAEGGGGDDGGALNDDDLDDLDAEGEIETLMDGDHYDDDMEMAGGNELLTTESTAPHAPNDAPPSVPDALFSESASVALNAPDVEGQTNPEPLPSDSTSTVPVPATSVEAPGTAIPATADQPDNANAQVSDAAHAPTTKSLEAASAEPTLLVIPTEDTQLVEETQIVDGSTQAVLHPDDNASTVEENHVHETPSSPTQDNQVAPVTGQAEVKWPPIPSANRLSISYAGGNRRLVINAETVSSMKLHRHSGRFEVDIDLSKDTNDNLKGILVETLSESKSYVAVPGILTPTGDHDDTVPQFSKLTLPTSIQLVVHLDMARPLSEPKWAKSGDVQDWLKSMFGRMFWVAGDAADGWEKKIKVVDPDPPPTIWTFLDGWASNSPVGALSERQRFVKTHMTEIDNVLEILLRLVRGERATPFSHNAPQISAPSLSGPLLSALSPGSAHGAQQTHVSLAVLAIFRLTVEYAKQALGDEKGKAEAEDKVGDIIRCLPSHLIYKSLDGMFKEWKMEKKGGRQ